jgi:photosystem II stability/assembly factor-like uncharacterized protein
MVRRAHHLLAPFLVGVALTTASASTLPAQAAAAPPAEAASALKLRGIGPAAMGGRIADIAVHPNDPRTWYVGVGSGGVWKTTNAGVTFEPVFDDQPSYSIGEVTIDPTDPEVVWVGTGENVSGRHVGWGDGVYRSRDGGRSWQRMGLPDSEHIGRILVDPRDGNTVLVAAEGPLWSAGGDRGVYRTTDGGETWSQVLAIDENTGATDLEFDPSNPDVVYAATYQRRRHIWGFLAGGPGSGLYKSTDNGATWRELTRGLPSGDMGKIGLAVTPADPAVVFATIEADDDERGFYRSLDRGESWEKRSAYISGGTGPHYYQEIEASPIDRDVVWQMDVFFQVSRDGGATWSYGESGHEKHSDNHALWIDPSDPRHMLAGSDAGLYESFDEGARWRHFPNLPIAQFYKVALNDRAPFYDVLGGAQDLGTVHGPSRTMNTDGIRNQDWYVPLGADGYGVAFAPDDPELMYLMWQEGRLHRKDRRNEEGVTIRPMPAAGDPPERWNWDSPLLVSPHDPDRVYYGSQRLWRSDDRGDSWTAISGDLTLGANRYERPYMGRVWSVDALHDNSAMSKYATTTAITESPVEADVLAVGTDDGLVQVSQDGGARWTRAAAMPDLPELSFINDVEASLFDARTLFAVADAHKIGDYAPYVYRSDDLGRSWRSIAGDLPHGTIAWAIAQDHVDPDLLFLGTERGLYWTPDAGRHWHQLAGAPTIPFRDVKIQRERGDVVGATFGRGFYVLDDYAPLRQLTEGGRGPSGSSGSDAAGADPRGVLFPIRDAWWFVPHQVAQATGRPTYGSDDFTAPNPPHGALITYWLDGAPTTDRDARRAEEEELRRQGHDVPFPGFDRLRAELVDGEPKGLILIADPEGRPVRTLDAPLRDGLHRVGWDMRHPSPETVEVEDGGGFRPPWATEPRGPLAAPGRYNATLVVVDGDLVHRVGEPQAFDLVPVPDVPGIEDFDAIAAEQHRTAELRRRVAAAGQEIQLAQRFLRGARAALGATPRAEPALYARVDDASASLAALRQRLYGDPARGRLDESDTPAIAARVSEAMAQWETRQPMTATQRRQVEIATARLEGLVRDVDAFVEQVLAPIEAALSAAGAPPIEGGGIR